MNAAEKLDAAQAAMAVRDMSCSPLPWLGHLLPMCRPFRGMCGFRHNRRLFAGHAQAATIAKFRQTHSFVLCNALTHRTHATQ
ncbi:hypothetical protein V5F44_00095 [Xanthobacter sp. V2C-8]